MSSSDLYAVVCVQVFIDVCICFVLRFDIEMKDYPGHFYGLSSIHPVPVSRVDYPDDYLEYENVAKLAISKYNRTYFRGTDRSTERTTFQATGSANKVNTKEKPRISSCKIKKAN